MTYAARLARNHEHKKMVNQYEFIHRLGRGQHGEVFVAMDTVKKQIVVRALFACYFLVNVTRPLSVVTCVMFSRSTR